MNLFNEFIIITTFLIHLFNQGDVLESLILFKSEKLKVKVFRRVGKYPYADPG